MKLLQDTLIPTLIHIFAVSDSYSEDDKATLLKHSFIAGQYFNEEFPDRRIGLRTRLEWPTRSRNLGSFDFARMSLETHL